MVCDECYCEDTCMTKKGRKLVCSTCNGEQKRLMFALARKRNAEMDGTRTFPVTTIRPLAKPKD